MAVDADAAAGQVDFASGNPSAVAGEDDRPLDDAVDAGTQDDTTQDGVERQRKPARSGVRWAVVVGLVTVLSLAGLTGWLGNRDYHARQVDQQRNLFLRVARQSALNLTTINYSEIDADVARILDSSTGPFRDDFQKRAQPFIDVVKQAKAKSEGTITAAGVESVQADQAQVLVAVSVKTSYSAGAAQQDPRAWRMRIGVLKAGDGAKVNNVEFVP